jgi:Cu+-exporting ATPase
MNLLNEDLSSLTKEPTLDFCTLDVKGMTCASCVSHVEKAISKINGVQAVTVNLATEQAKIRFHKDHQESVANIIEAIDKSGYSAQISNPSGHNRNNEPIGFWSSSGLSRVVIGFLISTPLMAPMVLMAFGIHFEIQPMLQFALAMPVQFWLGWRFYVGAYKALLSGTGNMDLLVCLGTSSAFGLSLYLLYLGQTSSLYFESSSVVISMVLLGKWLEVNAKHKTSSAIRELQKLWPESAHVIDHFNRVHEIELEHLLPGDRVKVFPSERIPVDGTIEEGTSQIDESMITGESQPILKSIASSVIGGSVNGDGFLIVKAQAIGIESTLSKMIELVENAQMQKAPIQKLVDQISAVFVPLVVLISIVTFVGNFYFIDSLNEAIMRSVSVLVIACPCALGLATPAAIMAGTGVAAKFGILIRDSAVLEQAHRIKVIAFDKTGTLTKGEPTLLETF